MPRSRSRYLTRKEGAAWADQLETLLVKQALLGRPLQNTEISYIKQAIHMFRKGWMPRDHGWGDFLEQYNQSTG